MPISKNPDNPMPLATALRYLPSQLLIEAVNNDGHTLSISEETLRAIGVELNRRAAYIDTLEEANRVFSNAIAPGKRFTIPDFNNHSIEEIPFARRMFTRPLTQASDHDILGAAIPLDFEA